MKIRNKSTAGNIHNVINKISKSIPKKSGLFLKKSNFIPQENDTQTSGNSQNMIPESLGIAQNGIEKSGSSPKSTQNNGT